MFLKLFAQLYTAFAFGIGFALVFISSLIRRVSIDGIFLTATFGGVGFLFLWGFFLYMLTGLLSEKELKQFFNMEESNSINIIDNDPNHGGDEEELSFETLYQNNAETSLEETSLENIELKQINPSIQISENPEYNGISSLKSYDSPNSNISSEHLSATMVDDDQFSLTMDGKTLTVPTKDGAKAIQKVLMDDKNEE